MSDKTTKTSGAGRWVWPLAAVFGLLAVGALAGVAGAGGVQAGPGPVPVVKPSAQPPGKILSMLFRRCSATDDRELRRSCRHYAKELMHGCASSDDLDELRRCRALAHGGQDNCEAFVDLDAYLNCMDGDPCPDCLPGVPDTAEPGADDAEDPGGPVQEPALPPQPADPGTPAEAIWELLFPGKFRWWSR
jgi:hypothetical protein